MATTTMTTSDGSAVVFSGVLHKKRGGFGRRASSPYVARYFELGADGVLGYYESTTKTGGVRGTMNLLSARCVLSVVATDPAGGSPRPTVLALAPRDGQRWKLCAADEGERDAWHDALAPYCRSAPAAAASPRARSAESPRGPLVDLPADLAAARRAAFARPPPAAVVDDAGGAVAGRVFASFVVTTVLAVAAGGRAFAVAALVFAHVYALLVLGRRGALDGPAWTALEAPATGALPSLPAAAFAQDSPGAADAKPRAGSVLEEAPFDAAGGAPPATWSRAPGSTFKVRQVGYKQTKKKAPSAEAFYEAVTVDMFDTGARVAEMATLLDLPTPSRPSPDPDVPALFVVVAQVPSETGPLKAKHDADGHGYQMAICFQLTAATARDLEALKTDASAIADDRRAALRLLKRYCRVAPGEPQLGALERGRFKVLAQIRNIDDVAIPAFAKGYNGKPALINKTGVLTRCGPDAKYLNMDVNIHGFGYMARSGLQSIFRDFQDFILSIGFTIESRADDELPEVMLGCFDLNHVDYNAAVPWDG